MPGMTAPSALRSQGFFLRRIFPFLLCILLLLGMLCASVAVGAVAVPIDQIAALLLQTPAAAALPPSLRTILLDIRLPHALFVMLVGMSLSASGCAYQGIFRNPLADPYLLGIGSGASLGAVAAITLPLLAANLPVVPVFAFTGALLAVILVYRGARPGRNPSSSTRLILAGVSVGAFANAAAMFLLYHDRGDMQRAMTWLMGGFSLGGWTPVWITAPYILLGVLALVLMGRVLNLLQFGEEQAEQSGLHVTRARWVLIAAASLTTAAGVSFGGVIGFIGLAVPHLARLMWGTDYRRLMPLSALLGAAVLLAADILARVLLAPQELPVGIVTALLGAPFFFYLLRRNGSEP
jgi:iron complex transport system permease protein